MRLGHYQFTMKPIPTLFGVLFFILFTSLSVWQIQRYHFKQDLLRIYQHNLNAAPQKLTQLFTQDVNTLAFQSVMVTGHFLPERTIVLQNQIHHHQVGFEILTPFQIAHEKKLLLIDRGWTPQLSDLSLSNKAISIKGYVKLLNEPTFILGKNILYPQNKPLTAQKIELVELAQLFHADFFPFIIRLSPDEPNGFIREWTIVTGLPERHLGYAIQWFLLAIVVLIGCFCFCCKKVEG